MSGEEQSDQEPFDISEPKKKRGSRNAKLLVYFGCFIVVLLLINISLGSTIVAYTKSIKDNVYGLGSASQLEENLLDLIYKDLSNKECKNGLTINPVDVCLQACNHEFCVGKFSSNKTCNGKHCNGMNVSHEDCKRGCLCCKAMINCLIENYNNELTCNEQTKECQHVPTTVPPKGVIPNDICYITSTSNCERANVGFNFPKNCI